MITEGASQIPTSSASSSRSSVCSDENGESCRVCHCFDSDKRGDAALQFLGISIPWTDDGVSSEPRFIEFISPDGEIFICENDIEMGSMEHHNKPIALGCACKNDLSLVHYACALKWFLNHGSTVCEICGQVAKNVRPSDLMKITHSLREYESLKDKTASGDPNPTSVRPQSDVDPDAVAAIIRQRLSEISLFFGTHANAVGGGASNSPSMAYRESERPVVAAMFSEGGVPHEDVTSKWAIEGTGILLAIGILTATLAWLIAPRVGKRHAKSVLHILLAGLCALAVVVVFRFVVLARIKYGPARYWAILFIFWFLIFGIWATRTHIR